MCAIIGFDSPTLTEQEIRPYFDRTVSRGPDMSRMEKAGRGMLGFHRLAIMGLHEEGMQPFHLGGDMAVCNGELYGFRPLKKELEGKGYKILSSEPAYIPTTYTRLESQDDMMKMARMIEMFEDNDDVQNIWHNWENEDEYEG